MKVKVRIRFRGREIDYLDLALKDLKEVAEELSDVAQVEQAPGLEGRSMLMVLAPARPKRNNSFSVFRVKWNVRSSADERVPRNFV
jgi:hypothetical protein